MYDAIIRLLLGRRGTSFRCTRQQASAVTFGGTKVPTTTYDVVLAFATMAITSPDEADRHSYRSLPGAVFWATQSDR